MTAVISWILALLATVIAVVSLMMRRRSPRVIRALRIAGPGAVLGTAAMVIAVVYVGGLFGLTQGDPARDLGKSMVGTYTDGGASLICDNGDNGHGPDNRTPWYEAYVDVPAGQATEAKARDALRVAGYGNAVAVKPSTDYADEAAAGIVEFRSRKGGRSASVTVIPIGSIPLYCSGSSIQYGQGHISSNGRALVIVGVNFPAVK